MSWLATGVTVGSSLYGTYSSIQSGKSQAHMLKQQGHQSMLTAYRRIADRNLTSYLATEDVKEMGGDAVINAYVASNKDIKNTETEASGSGAVISGTVKDVMRSKETQLDALVQSINDNTEKNIEGITRDTNRQNKEDLITAQTNQKFLNKQASNIHKANQRKMVAGIIGAAASGYTTSAGIQASGGIGGTDTAFWNKSWASWDQIKAGQFTLG